MQTILPHQATFMSKPNMGYQATIIQQNALELVRDKTIDTSEGGSPDQTISLLPRCTLNIADDSTKNEQQLKKLVLDTLYLASRGKSAKSSSSGSDDEPKPWTSEDFVPMRDGKQKTPTMIRNELQNYIDQCKVDGTMTQSQITKKMRVTNVSVLHANCTTHNFFVCESALMRLLRYFCRCYRTRFVTSWIPKRTISNGLRHRMKCEYLYLDALCKQLYLSLIHIFLSLAYNEMQVFVRC